MKTASHRTGFKILALVMGLAVFVAGDFAVRQIYLKLKPKSDKSFSHRTQNPYYDHGFRPMSRGIDHYGPLSSEIFINSLGMRDASCRVVDPQARTPRVLLLGDSFAEAGCIPWDKTFAGILAAYGTDKGVEVLNAGVASYCTATEAAKVRYLLEKEGLRFDHLVLFIDVSDVRDELFHRLKQDGYSEHVPTGPYTGGVAQKIMGARRFEDVYRWLGRNVENNFALLGALVRNSWQMLKDRHGLEAVKEYSTTNYELLSWPEQPDRHPEMVAEGKKRMLSSLDAILALSRKNGFSLTVVSYPWPDQVLHPNPLTPARETWRNWCGANRVPYLSLFEIFWNAGPPKEVVDKYYIHGDMHWNEAGHALVAKELMRRWGEICEQRSDDRGRKRVGSSR